MHCQAPARCRDTCRLARDVACAAADKFQARYCCWAPADAAAQADIMLLTTPANVAVATARALNCDTAPCSSTAPTGCGGTMGLCVGATCGRFIAALAAALPGVDVVKASIISAPRSLKTGRGWHAR